MSNNNDNRKKKTLLLIGLIIVFTILLFVVYIRNNVFYSPLVLYKNISYSSASEYFDGDNESNVVYDVINTNEDSNESGIENYYCIIFLDENGNELQRYAIKQGDIPNYNTELSALPKGFEGWDKELVPAYEDITYKAIVHKHDYVDTIVKATCVKNGYTLHKCKECGDEYTDNIVSALGHSFKTQIHDATCLEGGYTKHVCSICEYSYMNNYVSALGHDYDKTTISPTCLEKGHTTYTCSRCGDNYSDDYVPALGHDYGTTVVDPTCLEEGYTLYKCSRCDDNYTDDYVSELGHDYVYNREEVKDTVNGVTKYYKIHQCSRCEDEIEVFNYTLFNYVGNVQQFTIEKDGIYEIEAFGAACGIAGSCGAVAGGYVKGKITLHEGDTLYVTVGGAGNNSNGSTGGTGGYNGGGNGGNGGLRSGSYKSGGSGGGGATSVATTSGKLTDHTKTEFDENGIMVAGGAGGNNSHNGLKELQKGGNANPGTTNFGQGLNGRTGGNYSSGAEGNGGGGGGYFGGWASSSVGNNTNMYAYGGSSWTNSSLVSDVQMQAGVQDGNGKCVITFVSDLS